MEPTPQHSPPNRTAVLSVLVAVPATALTYWTIDIGFPPLPSIQESLDLSATGAQLVFALLFLGRLVANIPAATLIVRIGVQRTAVVGAVILGLGSGAAALATGPALLFPGRILQGIGISLLANAALRSLMALRPGQGAAMTIFTFATTVGGVLGLQSGGYLSQLFGWRAIFVASLGIAAAIAVASALMRPAFVLLPEETSGAAGKGLSGRVALWAVINFAVFGAYSLFSALPLYVERRFNASETVSANLLLVAAVIHVVASLPMGRVIRRYGAGTVLVAGLLTACAGLIGMRLPSNVWLLAIPVAVYGAGMVAAGPAVGDLLLRSGGLSTGALRALRISSDLGLVAVPPVIGVAADQLGYGAPFLVLAGITAVSATAVLVDGARRERPA